MSITKSTSETLQLARKTAEKVGDGRIICLYGDLGSGKTTFTKGLTSALGINEFQVKSPTYTYIRKYINSENRSIYHIDLYRIDTVDHLMLEEINELFQNPQSIIIIEWADKISEHLPKKRLDISFRYLDEHSREITLVEHE